MVLLLNLEAVMLPAGEARVDLSDEAHAAGRGMILMVLARATGSLPLGLLASERDV